MAVGRRLKLSRMMKQTHQDEEVEGDTDTASTEEDSEFQKNHAVGNTLSRRRRRRAVVPKLYQRRPPGKRNGMAGGLTTTAPSPAEIQKLSTSRSHNKCGRAERKERTQQCVSAQVESIAPLQDNNNKTYIQAPLVRQDRRVVMSATYFVNSYVLCMKEQVHCFVLNSNNCWWWNPIFHNLVFIDEGWFLVLFGLLVVGSFLISVHRVLVKPLVIHLWVSALERLWEWAKREWYRIKVDNDRRRVTFAMAIMLLQIRRREQIARYYNEYRIRLLRRGRLLRSGRDI